MEWISSATTFLASILVGSFFVFFGAWNIYHHKSLIALLTQKQIPFPALTLFIGIIWQILAGLAIISSIYPVWAALCLIPFTLIAVVMFHPFWRYTDEQYVLNLTIFVANVTVSIGSLLLIIAIHTR